MSGDNVVLARNVEGAPASPLHAQTVAFSHYNNLSAQLPLDPETGELVEGGALEQAAQCLENLEAVAEGIGHTLGDVARLTVFVRDIRDSTFDATFIRFVVELCHDVGIRVCLEGVEVPEEYEAVSGMGLDSIQGFLFGRPCPPDEFERKFLGKG